MGRSPDARRRRQTSRPSRRGMLMSRTTRSGFSRSTATNAASPSPASAVVMPALTRAKLSTSRIWASSSTIRMRWLIAAILFTFALPLSKRRNAGRACAGGPPGEELRETKRADSVQRLLRAQHRIDAVDDAVGLGDVGVGDGALAALGGGHDDVVARAGEGEGAAADGGELGLALAPVDRVSEIAGGDEALDHMAGDQRHQPPLGVRRHQAVDGAGSQLLEGGVGGREDGVGLSAGEGLGEPGRLHRIGEGAVLTRILE